MAHPPPSINPTLIPGRTGPTRFGREIICSFANCEFVAHKWSNYDDHYGIMHHCHSCNCAFSNLRHHMCGGGASSSRQPLSPSLLPPNFNTRGFTKLWSAHFDTEIQFRKDFEQVFHRVDTALDSVMDQLIELVHDLVTVFINLKTRLTLHVTLENMTTGEISPKPIYSQYMKVLNPSHATIESIVMTQIHYIAASLNTYSMDGSSWSLHSINHLILDSVQYLFRRGGAFIPTPRTLARKGIINVVSNDQCFKFATIASLYRHLVVLKGYETTPFSELTKIQKSALKKNWTNPKHYQPFMKKIESEVDFTGFDGSVSVDSIPEFEKRNGISITVTGIQIYEDGNVHVYPLKTLQAENQFGKLVDLVLLEDLKTKGMHFACSTNLGNLLGGKHSFPAMDVCRFCTTFIQPENLQSHYEECSVLAEKKILLPKSTICNFTKDHMREDIYFKCFYDFICTYPANECEKIRPYGFVIVIVGPDGLEHAKESYFGEDMMDKFHDRVMFWCTTLINMVSTEIIPVHLTPEEAQTHYNMTNCEVCHEPFSDQRVNGFKVVHHHHMLHPSIRRNDKKIYNLVQFTSHLNKHIELTAYQTLCQACNTKIRAKACIWISHNSQAHHHRIILANSNRNNAARFKIIGGKTSQIQGLILYFKKATIKFIDLKNFLNKDLADLHSWHFHDSWHETDIKYPFMHYFLGANQSKLKYVLDYERFLACVNSVTVGNDKFLTTDFLMPPTDINFDTNWFEGISRKFKCTEPISFLKLFLTTKVYILGSIFLKLIDFTLSNFKISVSHAASIGMFSWDSALANMEETFQNLQDEEMVKEISANIRGGLSLSNVRYSKSCTERLNNFTGKDEERIEILYADLNSTFGSILKGEVAVGDYKWLDKSSLENLDILNLPIDTGIGWCFVVDLVIDPQFHSSMQELAVAPTRRYLKTDLNSDTAHPYVLDDEQSHGSRSVLSCDLYPKKNYLVYYKNLLYYCNVKHARLVKVHKGFSFREASIFEPYVDLILDLRKRAKDNGDEIIANFLKVMYSAAVGTMLSSTKNHTSFKPALCRSQALRYAASDRFIDHFLVSERNDISMFCLSRKAVSYKYPILIGFQVLELNKLLMYKGLDEFQKIWPDSKLLAGNTDALALEIRDPNKTFLSKLAQLSHMMDFSGVDMNLPFYSTENKNVPGKWAPISLSILEFISLSPSAYSYLIYCEVCKGEGSECPECLNGTAPPNSRQVMKGLPAKIKRRLNHSSYVNALKKENEQIVLKYSRAVGNFCQQVIQETSFRPFLQSVPTRYFQNDANNSLPFGHYMNG